MTGGELPMMLNDWRGIDQDEKNDRRGIVQDA